MPTSNTATCAAEAAAEWWTETLRARRENLDGATALGRLMMGCTDAPTDAELELFEEKLRSSVSTRLETDETVTLEATLYASRELRDAAQTADFTPPWPKTVIMTVTVDAVTVNDEMGQEVVWRQPS